VAKQTKFISRIDFFRQLKQYCHRGRLLPTTKFITFDVTDLYAMILRKCVLDILERFLRKYSKQGKINNMTIDKIMKRAHLFLDTNCFAYQDKHYQQIIGGAMGSPFIMTLANIYMLEWEPSLVEHQKSHNELDDRYVNAIYCIVLILYFSI